MNVFTFQYETNCGDNLVSVYDSLDAVITRLKLMELHGTFDECETVRIDCQEILDSAEMNDRLARMKKHYEERDAK